MSAGESHWLVKLLEAPYTLEKIEFGLNAGFWAIKVRHYKPTAVDKEQQRADLCAD